MRQKLGDYIKELESKIKDDKIDKNLDEEVLTKIKFFQHERLVHLIVTFFVGISCIIFMLGYLCLDKFEVLLLFMLTLMLFIPYIFHYYYLENGVQKLYDLYFDIKNKK